MIRDELGRRLKLVLWAFLAAACSGGQGGLADTTSQGDGSSAQQVGVAVSPSEVTLSPGAQLGFMAAVTGSADDVVTWAVLEGDAAGTVTTAGAYTASAVPGTYHVKATSHADTSKSSTATITVVANPSVTVTLGTHVATVVTGGRLTFTAVVAGSTDQAVTWAVQEGAVGGSVTAGGLYTAPSTAGVYHVLAQSHADPTRLDAVVVTVTSPPPVGVSVAVTPGTSGVFGCQSLALSAKVTGSTNTAVTWTVQEGTSGGAVTSAGVYTAPVSPGTYHVVATSAADATRKATATLTVTTKVLSVAVDPPAPTVVPGAVQSFTATVTTTCGAFTST